MFKSKKNDRKYWLRRRYGQSRSRARIKRSTVKFEIFIELTFFKQKITEAFDQVFLISKADLIKLKTF